MADRVGQQLGNYQLIRLLGEGGFAEVYLAEHRYLKTQAAIKILQTRLGQDDLQGFLSEAQTIARMQHPHIVRVWDFGVEGSLPYLVMDYAPNGTLRARHPRGTQLAPAMILPYIRQVSEALHYAHEQKLIHRDIKPENMLLGSKQEVLLSDFGIATVAQTTGEQRTQGFAGTAAYAAPEQLRGKPVQASDQYALAVVVYEWLTGDTPFHGSSLEIATQHVLMPPPPLRERLPGVSTLVEQVVLTALAKTPRERFASVRAFANALEQAIQGMPEALAGYGTIMGSQTPTVRTPPQPQPPMVPPAYATQQPPTPPTPAPAAQPSYQPTPPPAVGSSAVAGPAAPVGQAPTSPVAAPPLTKAAPSPVGPPVTVPAQAAFPDQRISGPLAPGQPGVGYPPALPAPTPPRRGKRVLVLALLAALVVVAGGGYVLWTHTGGVGTSGSHSGAGTQTANLNLAANQVLTFASVGGQDISTMDPALVIDTNSLQALDLVFTGLVKLDVKTLQVMPDLASTWDISSGGILYTFHLRSGVKFSNGDPLTASDIAYSIDRAFDPAQNNKSATATYYLGSIVGGLDRASGKIPTMIGPGRGLEVVDDHTLQIRLSQPVAYFLEALTYPVSWAVDKQVVQQYGANWWDGHAVGTGPFILQSWQHKAQLIFVANPNWYGAKSHLTEIYMPLIADPNAAFQQFQNQKIDVDRDLTSANYAAARNEGTSRQWQIFEGPALGAYYLAPNSGVAPFDNLVVREAFAEAVDRDTIMNQVLGGYGLPTDHIVPQGQPGYYPGLKGLPFNAQDARTKLTSVYPTVSSMPQVTLEYASSGDKDKIVQKLQQDYQTYLGVHLALRPVSFPTLITDVTTGKVQFYLLGWVADYPDPQDWLDLVTSNNPNNYMRFSNPQVDSLVAQADVDQDQNARFSLYNQAEELAIDNVAWIPFEQAKNLYIFQNDVHGFVQAPNIYIPPDAWANVYICNGSC